MALKNTATLVPRATVCSINWMLRREYSTEQIRAAADAQQARELQAKRDWLLSLREDLRKRRVYQT